MLLEGSSTDVSPAEGDTAQISGDCSSARDYKLMILENSYNPTAVSSL